MDQTEGIRRAMVAEINHEPSERDQLAAEVGQVWDTEQLMTDFEVLGFAAPFVMVARRADGVKGSLTFQHSPRLYWGFRAH